ncbi:MAG: sigma-70 family RNA polymerase sigma factor [Candidatus Latescibacteria bacterium]|nr:sigma-70 family RNA polymerase sigma factor [Candidatus Latescibacterota bacterium]
MERERLGIAQEIELIQQAQRGNRTAFEHLYRHHVGRVYAICLRLSADADQAEELTQEVFIRAWQTLSSFRAESAFSSWLYRLAVNVAFIDRRSRQRHLARVTVTDDLSPYDQEDSQASPGIGLDLEQAIAGLPPQARQVFVLHDIEGYRHEEIARLMGLATGTSKAQLHRARKLLREVLER